MGDLLAEMAASSLLRADAAGPLSEVRARALDTPPAPWLWLDGFDVIAEIKLAAPSAGVLATPADPAGAAAERARIYAEAGAAAVSVLTEPLRFGGDLSHLAAAARACPVPVMRKDFLVDPVQVWEAREAGAGGVLLIARMLGDDALASLLAATREAGMFVLVEAFDGEDLRRAGEALAEWSGPAPALIGVNTRDLVTLEVEGGRLADLAPLLPPGLLAVAESGMTGPDDAASAARLGYRLALVGTALMRADDPGALVAAMRAAGEGACS